MFFTIVTEFHIESHTLGESQLDDLIDALTPWHGAVGTSAFGNAEATLSVPAENMPQALATLRLLLSTLDIPTLRIEVMPSDLYDKRSAVESVPELLTAQEAAVLLKVTRPAVIGMVERGELPRIRIGERGTAIPLAAVERLSARREARQTMRTAVGRRAR